MTDEHGADHTPDLLEALRGVLRVADRATVEFDAARAAVARAALSSPEMPRQTSYGLFGILNPHGHFWSRRAFFTPEEARSYIVGFWPGRPGEELDQFKIVPVRVTLEMEEAPACATGARLFEDEET